MSELLRGTGCLLLYFALVASSAFLLRLFTKVPDELFRKLLHLILLGSLPVWLFAFSNWYISALSILLFTVAVYPILCLAEGLRNYSHTVTERSPGELKRSLLIVFTMFLLIVSVCWGWLGDRLLALTCVYAWGFGDAAAALIGKRFGRHPLQGRHIEGRKSVEGTLAMFALSFLSVSLLLTLRGGLSLPMLLVVSAVTAAVAAAAELFSLRGNDTITCPLAAMAVLLPMLHFFGGGL